MIRSFILLPFAIALAACGDDNAKPDVEGFQDTNESLQSAVTTHCQNAGTMTDCAVERDRYAAEARPVLKRMSEMSGNMDACMADMGHGDQDDMRETCVAMQGELDNHAGAACTLSDMAQNRAEAERHCAAMNGMIQHERERASSMSGMMSDSMMSGGRCHR